MTIATLSAVLRPALADGYAVAGLVCLGWEDARAYVRAAEAEGAPVILQTGPACRAHTPLPVLGPMLRHLAETSDVPTVVHLDHGDSADICAAAIDVGFTSVMFDGSRLSDDRNIEETASIVELAHAAGVSCEGEIGFVGYAEGEASAGTDPQAAARFTQETGVDAVAVSVGNVHLQKQAGDGVDEARIAAIQAMTDTPLVIHGGSGVPSGQRQRLARETSVCKFNIGTELRMAFGEAIRGAVSDEAVFDRIEILKATEAPLEAAARQVMRAIAAPR
ncbi:MAG: class II fructose-bisphosphate aldolase [Pseudomonadota bacterium]